MTAGKAHAVRREPDPPERTPQRRDWPKRHSPGTSTTCNTHRRSSGPSLTGGCVVHPAQPVLRPPPTPTRPATHFPRSSVIKRHAPATHSAGHRAGEGLTSSRRPYLNVPSPIRPGVPQRLHIQVFSALHGLCPDFGSSALPAPAQTDGPLTTPQASHHATDRSVAPPSRAFDTGLRPDPFPDQAANLLPGLLTVTRTGLTPASDDELTTKDHLHKATSDPLVARKVEVNLHPPYGP